MNAAQLRMQQVKKPLGPEYFVPHYVNLFWRWKWYICLVSPLVFLGWSFTVVKFGPSRPALDSRVVLEFVQTGGGSGSSIQAMNIQQASCDALLHSRGFLENVVEKLSLQVSVKKYFRSEIFDSISIEKNAPIGTYYFVVDKDGYALYFSNKIKHIEKRSIAAGKLFELNSFSFPAAFLKLSRDFIAEPHSMTFFITPMREAVDHILWYLTIRFPGAGEGSRDNSVMTMTLKGADYPLTTQIVNTIADDFVAHNNDLVRSKKSDNISDLEKQLQTARSELENAEAAMREFREANPSVGGSSVLGASMTEVSSLENSVYSNQRIIDDAVALQARCKGGLTLDDQISAMFEGITFLSMHQSVAAWIKM